MKIGYVNAWVRSKPFINCRHAPPQIFLKCRVITIWRCSSLLICSVYFEVIPLVAGVSLQSCNKFYTKICNFENRPPLEHKIKDKRRILNEPKKKKIVDFVLKNERTLSQTAVCLLSFLSSGHESWVSKGCLPPVLHLYELVSHIWPVEVFDIRPLLQATEFSLYHCCDMALRRTWLRTFLAFTMIRLTARQFPSHI